MTKQETISFIKKIKAYYPIFKLEEEGIDEWAEKLKPYDTEDVIRKFEEHLSGEQSNEPPKLHFITRYLKTKEEKEKHKGEYIIRCNLCGREMYYSEYDKHYEKCLLIKALIPLLKKRGENVDYETLNDYDFKTLDKVWDKYNPPKKQNLKEVIGSISDGRSN